MCFVFDGCPVSWVKYSYCFSVSYKKIRQRALKPSAFHTSEHIQFCLETYVDSQSMNGIKLAEISVGVVKTKGGCAKVTL